MKKEDNIIHNDDLLNEYDFSNGVRGKYAAKLAEENGYIKVDPVVFKYFKKAENINKVLLAIIQSLPDKRKPV